MQGSSSKKRPKQLRGRQPLGNQKRTYSMGTASPDSQRGAKNPFFSQTSSRIQEEKKVNNYITQDDGFYDVVSLDSDREGQSKFKPNPSPLTFKTGTPSLAQHIALLKQSLEAIESDKEGEDARVSQEV